MDSQTTYPDHAKTERVMLMETLSMLRALDARMTRVESRVVNTMRHFNIDIPGGGPRKPPTQLGRIT